LLFPRTSRNWQDRSTSKCNIRRCATSFSRLRRSPALLIRPRWCKKQETSFGSTPYHRFLAAPTMIGKARSYTEVRVPALATAMTALLLSGSLPKCSIEIADALLNAVEQTNFEVIVVRQKPADGHHFGVSCISNHGGPQPLIELCAGTNCTTGLLHNINPIGGGCEARQRAEPWRDAPPWRRSKQSRNCSYPNFFSSAAWSPCSAARQW